MSQTKNQRYILKTVHRGAMVLWLRQRTSNRRVEGSNPANAVYWLEINNEQEIQEAKCNHQM